MQSVRSRFARPFAVASVAVAAFALTACGGGNTADPLAPASEAAPGATTTSAAAPQSGGPIVVGSANFTESQVLAELYSQALQAKGIESSTKPAIGSREVYLKALKDGSVQVVPEYTGNLLLFLDSGAKATTAEEIEAALPEAAGSELAVLKPSEAADQDVYVVTKEFSEKNGVTSLADLKKIAGESTLGGPSELKERAYGPPGLDKLYDAKFKAFEPYDSGPIKVKDLNDKKIQVATFFTTESAIIDNNYVMLDDPKAMILPQNVVPLVSADVAQNAEAVAAIEAVQAALTTDGLTKLNKAVDVEQKDARGVAGEFLASNGLA